MGYGDNKTRLFTPIRSKTPALQRRGLHLGAGRERSRSALRGDDAARKRSHRNGFSSFERVRLLQPLLPRPQKGWRPPAHPRSQTPESCPHETAVQDDHAEADPLADSHRGLVLFSGPERRILSHPDSPPSQTILEIPPQTEPRSGYVISEQCPLRGVDAPSAGGSEDLEDLWQGRSRPFRLQRQLSLPNLLFKRQGRVGPRLAQPPPLCIPPDRPASTGRQANQGTGSQGAIGGPLVEEPTLVVRADSATDSSPLARAPETGSPLSGERNNMASTGRQANQGTGSQGAIGGPLVEEPTLVVRADSATDSSPLARAPETGSPLSGERNNMAPSTRAVGSLHLAAQWEPTGLPERVLNTISEARAPSTRRLYALKWSVFSTWCLNRGENPSTSELAVVLSFLQELLDKGRSHSTLKVCVAALAAFYAPIAGQSVGRDNSVVRFLKGARRLNPPRPLTVPTWDLPTVLRALKGPPFEPLQSTDLRSLSLKTALLLALASV